MANQYERRSIFKWAVTAIFAFFGVVAAYYGPLYLGKFEISLYKRDGLDELTKAYFGTKNVEDALTDEILLVAYEFNTHQPRFYSKYFAG